MKKLKVLKERSSNETDHPNDLRGLAADPILEDSRIESVLVAESDAISVHPDALKDFGVKEATILDNNGEQRKVFRRTKAASGSHFSDSIYLYGLAKVIMAHQPEIKLQLSLVNAVKASVMGAANFLDQAILDSASNMSFAANFHVDPELVGVLKASSIQDSEQTGGVSNLVAIGSRLRTGA
jgi:hypothetical protein